jgi:spore germination protein YaaH
VISGNEGYLKAEYPLSDVAYFGAEVDSYGQLVDIPNPNKIAFFRGRKHLVIACNSTALTHFVLEPDSAVHKRLVTDLINAAKPFDGLQIDFENIPARDGDTFRSFLGELKRGLGDKMLTIALKARMRTIKDDVYDYGKIKPLVDRILVMAYDEHWSTSEPGSIASLDWCRSIAAYAMETVGPEKLIMGLPFYGRTWGDVNTFRAFYYSGIERIKNENNVTEVRRERGIPTFSYEIPVTVTVYYEDVFSLSSRLELYRTMGVQAAGFWAMGQETPAVWNILRLEGQ